MNIIREMPLDAGPIANFLDCFFGSTDWVFEHRLAQFRGNLLSTCDEIEYGLSELQRSHAVGGDGLATDRTEAEIAYDWREQLTSVSAIRDEIRKADRWSEIFRLEQSLVNLMSDQAVVAELRRRRAELYRFTGSLQAHYQFEIKNLIDDTSVKSDALRKLLFRLVKYFKWCDLISFHHHVFVCQLTQRVNVVFTLSMILFFILVMVMFSTAVVESIYLYLAMITGVFGASFSMLISLEERVEVCDLDQLRSIRAWPSLLMRIFAGAGGGLLLYFFVLSGVITMQGLPPLDMRAKCTGGCVADNLEWGKSALFVLLAFISGFIEKLIPGLIRTTGSKLSWADTDTSEIRP